MGQLRGGTILGAEIGCGSSVLDRIASGGYTLLPSGLLVKEGEEPHPFYYFGPIPRPEDHILSRSGVTLDELYSEDATLQDDLASVPAPAFIGAQPAPMAAGAGPLQATGNRRERRRRKAMQRKRGGETIH